MGFSVCTLEAVAAGAVCLLLNKLGLTTGTLGFGDEAVGGADTDMGDGAGAGTEDADADADAASADAEGAGADAEGAGAGADAAGADVVVPALEPSTCSPWITHASGSYFPSTLASTWADCASVTTMTRSGDNRLTKRQ